MIRDLNNIPAPEQRGQHPAATAEVVASTEGKILDMITSQGTGSATSGNVHHT